MKIIHRKNSIRIKSSKTILPFKFIIATYLTMSTFLGILYPIVIIPTFLILAVLLFEKDKLRTEFNYSDIKLSTKGIRITKNKFYSKLFLRDQINVLYVQEINGALYFFINNKEQSNFSLPKKVNSNSFLGKIRRLLKLELINTQKTKTGKILKYVNKATINQKKNHFKKAKVEDSNTIESKSPYFTIDSNLNSLDVNTSNNIGLHKSKLIVDRESNSIKIHLDNKIPDEINFNQIASIKVSISQNASGESGDLIEGKLLIVTNDHKVITLFHTKIKEKNLLDFTADQLKLDLNALKATIEIFIYSHIDEDLNTLDLDALNKEHEKLKDILPNRDNLEL